MDSVHFIRFISFAKILLLLICNIFQMKLSLDNLMHVFFHMCSVEKGDPGTILV